MDSITHLALGACMGGVFAEKKLKKKALLWGAVAQSIPDIDFLASFWMDTASNLLAHRGFTHSLLFVGIISPLFAALAERWHRPHDISFGKWLSFFLAVIGTHVFFDAFNNYGVGWWEPFSHIRISFDIIYVADPFFSIWPAIAVGIYLFFPWLWKFKFNVLAAGLILSTSYLGYGCINKLVIESRARQILQDKNIMYTRLLTTPAPLQNWLWYIVAADSTGYHIGFQSLFESGKNAHFEYFPKNDSLLQSYDDHTELNKLKRFSKGYYTAEKWGDTLVFNDLRFGQMIGWQDPKQNFVFHYFLRHDADNTLVVQRGRFKYWDKKVISNFMNRIFYAD